MSARLAAVSIAAATLCVLLAVPQAEATTQAHRTVALRATLSGQGTLNVTGNPSFNCRAKTCTHTFHIHRGQRTVVTARPSPGWKLHRWAGACKGSSAMCSLRLKAERTVAVSFVPPGDRRNPYPLGTATGLYGGWTLKVNSASVDADAEVEAVIDPSTGKPANTNPLPGEQYALVNVSMTYLGAGSIGVGNYVFSWLGAKGPHNTLYQPACTPPPVDLSRAFQPVPSGRTVTGNLCFDIASNDAAGLLLGGYATSGTRTVWFALHD